MSREKRTCRRRKVARTISVGWRMKRTYGAACGDAVQIGCQRGLNGGRCDVSDYVGVVNAEMRVSEWRLPCQRIVQCFINQQWKHSTSKEMEYIPINDISKESWFLQWSGCNTKLKKLMLWVGEGIHTSGWIATKPKHVCYCELEKEKTFSFIDTGLVWLASI